ncbi:MAG: M28 family peptidase [Dysgonamonadaceae bacterium]|jgi:hypothetical protein|nr:M28 family peptidase [Dysgonamonadaceae bacterium]
MKKYSLIIALSWAVMQPLLAQTSLKERLEKHVYTLAGDSLMGRKAGSDYGRQASEYIVNQWKEIGIPPCKRDSYFQEFSGKYRNIIGIIEGNDPVLKDEYIVVGAHYDHLGFKVDGDTIIYNGADDNASGVAALTELGRELCGIRSSLRRSIILVAFDAEEIGLFGSQHFVNNPFIPLEKIKLMFSVDMVGWLKAGGKVEYKGAGSIDKGEKLLLDAHLIPEGLRVTVEDFENSIFTATDTEPFAKKGISTLAVTTGLKSPYHKPGDDAHLIDYDGLALITEHLKNIVLKVSQDPDFKSSGKLAKKHRSARKRLTFGLSANIGSNYHHYSQGALDGKKTTSFGAGLMTQINCGKWAIRPEIYYDLIQANHPGGKIQTNNLTVPLSLVLQTPFAPFGADVFLGGYYSYRFDGKQGKENIDFNRDFYRNEGGLTYGFGLYMGNIKLGYTGRTALTRFSREKNADNAHLYNRIEYFTLTYLF